MLTGHRIGELEGSERVTAVLCDDPERIEADVVLLGLGRHAEVWLAMRNGIPIGESGAILGDP